MASLTMEDGQTVVTPDWLTVPILRSDYLFGLPLLSTEFGNAMAPDTLARYLIRSQAVFKREAQVDFTTKHIVSNAEKRGLVKGTDYDVDEEPYDWHPDDYNEGAITFKLRRTPVQKVVGVSLHVPNGDKVMDYPPEWIHVERKNGLVRIYPWGTQGVNVYTYSGYPFYHTGWSSTRPGGLWVDYFAGMVPDPAGDEADIIDYMYKFAAIMALDVSGDAFMPGVSSYSLGLDGLSESLSQTSSPSFAAFGARRKIYADEITAWFAGIKDNLKGPRFTVL